jgi:Phage integrase family
MSKSKSRKKRPPKRVLALPDLEHAKTAVLNSLTSASGQRTYDHAIREFVAWYCSEPRLAFNRTVVLRYRIHLEQRSMRLVDWVRPAPRRAVGPEPRVNPATRRALGDCRCGRQGRARAHRPIPTWVKSTVDAWMAAAAITHGRVFRAINEAGRVWGDGMSPKVLWDVVRAAAARAAIDKLAPHDLRRTRARLCHLAGGELDQIQFLLGHVSIQTTERYLGCKQKLRLP